MRDYLDSILASINSESLTDSEFEGIDLEVEELNQDTFDSLKVILEVRGSIDSQLEKLAEHFIENDVELSNASDTPTSEIFFGAGL